MFSETAVLLPKYNFCDVIQPYKLFSKMVAMFKEINKWDEFWLALNSVRTSYFSIVGPQLSV